jgi:hypothetical protein
MIEVFKTGVTDPTQADRLRGQIHRAFPRYRANFDLEDCDRILRVEHPGGEVRAAAIIHLLYDLGVQATILPDEAPWPIAFENELRDAIIGHIP